MSMRVINGSSVWWRMEQLNIKNAVSLMAGETLADSRARAPYLTGALRASGVDDTSNEGSYSRTVGYGNARVPYARRRHFENKRNPQTTYYLWNAGEKVVKKGIKRYLRYD